MINMFVYEQQLLCFSKGGGPPREGRAGTAEWGPGRGEERPRLAEGSWGGVGFHGNGPLIEITASVGLWGGELC